MTAQSKNKKSLNNFDIDYNAKITKAWSLRVTNNLQLFAVIGLFLGYKRDTVFVVGI